MIQANIIGNLGRDAEVKKINDKDYLSFSVASTEKKGDQETTTWVSCLASNNPNLLPYLKKGQQVFVSGRMSARIYQSDNNIGMDISLFAHVLQLCGGKRDEGSVSSGSAAAPATQPPSPPLASTPFPPPVDENGNPTPDDLPF